MTTNKLFHILVVDDDSSAPARLKIIFHDEPTINIESAIGGEEAIKMVTQTPSKYAVILVDYLMPKMNGAEVARQLLKINPHLLIAMNSADKTRTALKESFKAGALDFIEKSTPTEDLKRYVFMFCKKYEEVVETFEEPATASQNEKLIESVGMVGSSDKSAQVASHIHRAAKSTCSVLTLGESGTGKELVARAIHNLSTRHACNFVTVNMAAIPEQLFESEMFGHVKGAFTSAVSDKIGKFKLANGGTIFLDEIGDMPPSQQVKLLRVLQEGEITPVGSNKTEKVNVRVIAATNRNLEEAIYAKSFRQDLYYRLNVFPIEIPPLRERLEDIRPLVRHFKKIFKATEKAVGMDVIRKFERYKWPGNIRELEHEMERLLTLAADDFVTSKHLDAKFFDEEANVIPELDSKKYFKLSYKELMNQFRAIEGEYLRHKVTPLKSIREVSREIEIPFSTLQEKVKAYAITK